MTSKRTPEELLAEAQSAILAEDWQSAVKAFEMVLAAFGPPSASVLYNLGLALKHAGCRQEALDRFEQTLAQEPNHVNAQFELAAALMDLGHTREALDAFDAYLSNAPEDVDAKRNRARLLIELGQWTEAENAWSEFTTETDHEAALMAIKLASELGRLDDALAFAKKLGADRQELRVDILRTLTHTGKGTLPMHISTLFPTTSRTNG